ncbi:MAG: MFS transporter [Thermoplasmatota archaeon]
MCRALLPSWADRNFHIVFIARVAMSVGRALAGIVTPIYLAVLGFGPVEIALYVVAVSAASTVLSAVLGFASDRYGRKRFLVAVPFLSAAAGVAFAYTSAAPWLFVMGSLGTFGRGTGAGAGAVGPYQPVESAFVTEDLAPAHRNDAFGRLSFGASLGGIIGGLGALIVPVTRPGLGHAVAIFRPAFLFIAILSALAGAVAMALDERVARRTGAGGTESDRTNASHPGERTADSAPPRRGWFPRRSAWLLSRLWATNAVNGLAVGMFGPFVTYWFFVRFGAGPQEIGVLFAIINAATLLSALSAASFARRWGLVRTVAIFRTAQGALLIPMVLAPTFLIAGAIYLVRMMVQRVAMPLRQGYVLDMAAPEERASVAALANIPSQVAMTISPLASGYLFEEVSLAVPFEVSGALQIVNAALFWAFFRAHPPSEERQVVAPLEDG